MTVKLTPSQRRALIIAIDDADHRIDGKATFLGVSCQIKTIKALVVRGLAEKGAESFWFATVTPEGYAAVGKTHPSERIKHG